MRKEISNQSITLSNLILYILGFFLIWEWLKPLEQLTDTGNIIVFILFLALSLFLAYFRTPMLFSGIIKSAYILIVLHYLYYEESFLAFTWMFDFVSEILSNVAVVFNTDWPALTDMFKSLLFFVLLWLMSYLIDYWLIKRRKIFMFFLLTIMYITVLDTFTLYNAELAIIRTVIIGFTSMGMLTYFRIRDHEGFKNDSIFTLKWMLPLLICVGLSTSIGFFSPKADPIWPDPVPFIHAMGNKGGNDGVGSGPSRVGYGVDDSNLGGDFIGDNTLVFEAEVESSHYWKVETKDTYTGKGWVQSEEALALTNEQYTLLEDGDSFPFESFEAGENVKGEDATSTVLLQQPFSFLLYPLGATSINTDGTSVEIEYGNERGIFMNSIHSYSIDYLDPEFSLTALVNADMEAFANENPEMADRYLQLPDNLPQRVKDLAVEITETQDNTYTKVRAIESYFSRNGFAYSQRNVAVPEAGQDYVDQFLFDTKLGYCDNYSTSMVVLLRSIGIPARWVKGFTEGNVVSSTSEGSVYQVTNNNAHSWVEVYFPEVGWVAFEPTQGFSNANTYLNDVQNESSSGDTETDEQEQQPEQAEDPTTPEQAQEKEQVSTTQTFSISQWWNSVKLYWNNHWKWITGIAVGVVSIIVLLFIYRYKWLPYYYIWAFKRRSSNETFPKAYIILLRLLKIAGLGKKEDITLREYAKQIDHMYSSEEMAILTASYEEYLYRGKLKENSWNELKELWENLIKRTTA